MRPGTAIWMTSVILSIPEHVRQGGKDIHGAVCACFNNWGIIDV